MTEKEISKRISSYLTGLELNMEQALESLEQVIAIKTNELLLEHHFYKGKDFSPNDIRFEYMALKLAHDLIEREILLEKQRKEAEISEIYNPLIEKAYDIYNENLECDYCIDALGALVDFAMESEDNLERLITEGWGSKSEMNEIKERAFVGYSGLRESIECFLGDNCLSEDYKELCDELLPEDRKPAVPYLIYAQNDECIECKNREKLIESFTKMTKKNPILKAIVFSVEGVVFTGNLDTEGLNKLQAILETEIPPEHKTKMIER